MSEPLEPTVLPVRTRGYECDPTRTVPAPVLLSYCEHARWEMMQDPLWGLIEHVHAGHFFVVLEQRIEVLRRVGMGVELEVATVLTQVGRSSGWVRHVIRRADDKAWVANAVVRGAWMGPSRRLARIPDAMREVCLRQRDAVTALGEPDTVEGVDGGSEGSWFDPPQRTHASLGLLDAPPESAAGPVAATRVVQPHDVDIFDHVNASTYLRFVTDALAHQGQHRPVRAASLGYRQEAVRGDALAVRLQALGPDRFDAAIHRGDEVLFGARVVLS